MHKILSLCLLWLLACTTLPSRPKVDPADCVERLDCHVVKVDNSSSTHAVDFRFNGVKFATIESFSSGTYIVYDNQLVHGKCAVASIRFEGSTREFINSDEQCIQHDQYYSVHVMETPVRYVWLSTFMLR